MKDYKQAVNMYRDGLSIQNVADFYNITRQAMWKILKRRGVKLRPQVRFGKDNHFFRGTSASDRVHNIFESAVEKGIVVRKSKCQCCGSTKCFKNGRTSIHAHHCDYNKPLDVMWLCQLCHHEWHKNNKAIPYNGGK